MEFGCLMRDVSASCGIERIVADLVLFPCDGPAQADLQDLEIPTWLFVTIAVRIPLKRFAKVRHKLSCVVSELGNPQSLKYVRGYSYAEHRTSNYIHATFSFDTSGAWWF